MSSAAPNPEVGLAAAPGDGGKALAGFMLSGFLLALLGAILPAWGYNWKEDPSDFIAVGNYFLCLGVGIVAASAVARRVMARWDVSLLLVFGCGISCLALLFLAWAPPLYAAWWRAGGLLVLGTGAGSLNMALFHAISKRYQADAAGTVNLGGVWYGVGCLTATLLVAGTFFAYTVTTILIFMAVVPGIFAVLYGRKAPVVPPKAADPTLRQALEDFRSPGAVMFALLLFFQFGNEWTIAGWLPLFLLRRIQGVSPQGALLILALYWSCLLGGRLGAAAILPHVRHRQLLLWSVAASLFGCLVLFFTDNRFGASMGALFLGCGYASIYPLVAEAIGHRFPYYHPGFFNGIFSLALLGGLLAPATLGYAAAALGNVRVVMAIPLIGTCVVMLLLVGIWLEAKVTGR